MVDVEPSFRTARPTLTEMQENLKRFAAGLSASRETLGMQGQCNEDPNSFTTTIGHPWNTPPVLRRTLMARNLQFGGITTATDLTRTIANAAPGSLAMAEPERVLGFLNPPGNGEVLNVTNTIRSMILKGEPEGSLTFLLELDTEIGA